jgi:hypothetical protein
MVRIVPPLLLAAVAACAHGTAPPRSPDADTLGAIARDIERLQPDFPQLEAFSAARNLDAATLQITYAYRTHAARHPGGWTAGVPNPDDDGLWFLVDFHDPASTAQLHTQPMTGPALCLGDKRVAFLILEGAKARPVQGAIHAVLVRHGVVECER